jgi:hypothetical protein
LAVAVAVAVGVLPLFVVVHPIVITVQPDVIPTDKVDKVEPNLLVAQAVPHGLVHLQEVLQGL